MSIAIYHKRQKIGLPLTYIREVYRHPKTHAPTSRILESFGRVINDPVAMEKVRERLAYYKEHLAKADTGEPDESSGSEDADAAYCIGFAPFLKLWEGLGLDKYFKKVTHNCHLPYDLNQYAAFLCCQRIFRPASKIESWRLKDCTAFDFQDVKLWHVYEVLDELNKRKQSIVDTLNQRVGELLERDLTIALYDVTTLYFESFDEGSLRRRGLSKEHRTQETQVVLGLLVDAEGIPLDFELFPGNTAEIHTMLKVIKDYAKRYGLGKVTVVADTGLNQLINLQKLKDEGYRFIVNWPPYSKLDAENKKEFLKPEGWMKEPTRNGVLGFKEMEIKVKRTVNDSTKKSEKAPKGEEVEVDLDLRIVGIFSEDRKKHDVEVIEDKWEKAKNLASKGPKRYASSSKKGARAYLNTEVKSVKVNDKYYQKKLEWAGYTGIATNIPKTELAAGQIYNKLRQLWRIEYNFRLLKTNLSARPVFVWKDPHVRGHVLMCYISLVLLRLMDALLEKANVDISEMEAVLALKTLFIAPAAAVDKNKSGLVHHLCIPEKSVDANPAEDKLAKTRLEECKAIFKAIGIKPLRSFETLRGAKTKLGVKFDLRKDLVA